MIVAQWNQPKDWAGDERNIILALARIGYTAVTGEIASKSDAATWLLDMIDPPHRPILSKAHAIHLGLATDDLAERHAGETAAFIAYALRAVERTCAAG
ncbi:DUF4111 domain-containing protein [Achromobacter mucicolens]|uniref:aminoglycoside adenylyltransferase domain-containing protein n=1 Tax=Achromobacter mucicolens TaxID=1389922 RepID=UPI002446DEDF|nr:aminoglycoside adenylyltransferase domain-containing protein [Achromobacter mucicolens]MDH0091158.1 DUF4111 domain-containing protein [Achromobacter mucicolens]